MITDEILKQIYPSSTPVNRLKYIDHLNRYMEEFEINSNQRKQFFLSQIGHESGQLRYCEEIASGAAYEGRADLGNVNPGDGIKFKGRGLIQITGRSNYFKLSRAFAVNFVMTPELLKDPKYAVRSACWFWKTKGLNEIADTGDFKKVTKRINGGYNGLEDRTQLLELCKQFIIN